MDHKPSHREMTSVLLADLYNHSLAEKHYASGYDALLKNADELVIDTPSTPTILGNFIARSIADDCIPPKFLASYKGQVNLQLLLEELANDVNAFVNSFIAVGYYVSHFTVETYYFADGRCLFKQPQSVLYHWNQYDEEI